MLHKNIYVENSLPFMIYLLLEVNNGRLTITAYRPKPDDPPATDSLEAGKAAVYPLNALLKTCIRGNDLSYEFRNRTGIPVLFKPGRARMPDGPIFELADGQN